MVPFSWAALPTLPRIVFGRHTWWSRCSPSWSRSSVSFKCTSIAAPLASFWLKWLTMLGTGWILCQYAKVPRPQLLLQPLLTSLSCFWNPLQVKPMFTFLEQILFASWMWLECWEVYPNNWQMITEFDKSWKMTNVEKLLKMMTEFDKSKISANPDTALRWWNLWRIKQLLLVKRSLSLLFLCIMSYKGAQQIYYVFSIS